MKRADNERKQILERLSTLYEFCKNVGIIALLLVMTVLCSRVTEAQSLVDPSFNPQIRTNLFTFKEVTSLAIQPDGKILAAGIFNSYNRQPVGNVVRLNPDGSLDTSFNSPSVESGYPNVMILQADGKILLRGLNMVLTSQPQSVEQLIRLNSDGTLDTTFDYNGTELSYIAVDAAGRILCSGGSFSLIRLNNDGSQDPSFVYSGGTVGRLAAQNNKVIIETAFTPFSVKRLNEDGTLDGSFAVTSTNPYGVVKFIVQPDQKILVLDGQHLRRFNENGGDDPAFTPTTFGTQSPALTMDRASDGRIIVALNSTEPRQVKRFLADGALDTSFATYNATQLSSIAVQANGSVIIGDRFAGGNTTNIQNYFSRLLPTGTLDTAFNQGGIGFQNLVPAAVRAFAFLPNGKILIGGKFDIVNETSRYKIARLNPDSTLDATFQVNVSGIGNSFTVLNEIYNVILQPDGKLLVTGSFIYRIGGVEKINVVRLNPDGVIDPTFNLNIFTYNREPGTNKIALLGDGKMIVGTSRNGFTSGEYAPLKLNADGTRDTSFSAPYFSTQQLVYVLDLAIQPDGKIIVGGRYYTSGTNTVKSFLTRLNSEGSLDATFQSREITDKTIEALTLLPSGKIVVVEGGDPLLPVQPSNVLRLNSNGSVDTSFDAGTGPDGNINAILLLPTGKIFLGGKFTNFNGQTRQNLAQINADGSLNTTTYNLNAEVMGLAVESVGRVLVGGAFTTIQAGGGGSSNRTCLARLIDLRTRFDFDGDGRADIGVFNSSNRTWSILNSQTNQPVSTQFGLSTDQIAPADFDGDGKTDIAVYRPSEGNWYLLRSTAGFGVVRFGASGDKPVPADFDGDGKADVAVWRPGSGDWYVLKSTDGQALFLHFGLNGDIPLRGADLDGDGKADIAVWRPSNGNFYWLASGSGNQFRAVHFGQNGDIPSVGDFNGDGKTDLVVFRPSDGNWYQYLTQANGSYLYAVTRFGLNGDEPVAADYNGDGKTDIALRRNGVWHLLLSGQGYSVVTFGNPAAQAIAALP